MSGHSDCNVPDAELVERARADSSIVVAFDLDFGDVLALGVLDRPDDGSESAARRHNQRRDDSIRGLDGCPRLANSRAASPALR